MARIAVAGLVNVETTLKIDGFPVEYAPVRYPFFGVGSSVSGVGYNVAKALTTLGHAVDLLTMTGEDDAARLVRHALADSGVSDAHLRPLLANTPQSVILYDPSGRRAIFTDLKDIQERAYPVEQAAPALDAADLAVLCNINFARPLLAEAQARGVPIATDIHAISDLHDGYNREYMAAASVLFQSHEHLPCRPDEWIRQLWATYGTRVCVVGMGAEGALLGVLRDGSITHVPAVQTRPIVSTIGAGDALFSAFLHTYAATQDPYLSLRKAVVFASYKIGVAGAAGGFLTSPALDALCGQVYGG
jgi:ribokinase